MTGKLVAAMGFMAVTAANAAGTLALAWSDCSDSSTHAKVTGLTPSTLTLGQKTRAVGTGTLDTAVTGGTFAIDLKAGLIKEHWTGDICAAKTFNLPLGVGSITWDGLSCPLAAGNVSVPVEILLSSNIPSALASSTISITAATSAGDKLLCMTITTRPTAVEEIEVTPAVTPVVNSGTLNLNWKDCGDASTHGKVQSLTPSTLVLGQKTHAVGTGTLDEAVPGGSYNIDVKAGLINEHWTGEISSPKTFNLPLGTGSITWNGLKTPLAAGTISVPMDILLSANIPSSLASATITVTATATSGDKLLCMEIDTKPATGSLEVVV